MADDAGERDADGGQELEWQACEPWPDLECASLSVPRHWDEPEGEQIVVRVARMAALSPERKLGTALVNLTGTGSGVNVLAQYAPVAATLFGELAERFDLVAIDRRGVGGSAPVDCIDAQWLERQRRARIAPTSDAEWEEIDVLYADLASRCEEALTPRGWLGSDQVARDIEALRKALGDTELTVVGEGYSGLVVGFFAAEFPHRIRTGAVVATVPPPEADTLDWYRTRAAIHDQLLAEFFDFCSREPTCAFHGGSSVAEIAAAYDALAANVRAAPLDAGSRQLSEHDFAVGVARGLDGSDVFSSELSALAHPLAAALAQAEAGDATALLELADPRFGRRPDGTYDTVGRSLFHGLVLADHVCPHAFDVAQARAAWQDVQATAPRLGPVMMARALVCLHGVSRSQPASLSAPSAPALLLTGSPHDSVSTLDGANDFALALGNDSYVLEYASYGSATHLTRSRCVADALVDKLLDPDGWTPPPGDRCP